MAIRVERYGLREPTYGADIVAEQMRKAHAYRNKLTEIERERRARMREVESSDQTVGALFETVEATKRLAFELGEEAKAHRAKSGKAAPSRSIPADLRARLTAARKEEKEAKKKWREAREAAEERLRPKRDAINEGFLAARKRARSECGVYWGTYQLAEDAISSARKEPLWNNGEPLDPKFRRWTGEGSVSVQISDGVGLLPEDLTSCNGTQVRFAPEVSIQENDRRDPNSKRSKRIKRYELWLRVGSDSKLNPVWAKWPMTVHRPLPDGSRVKRVSVHRRHVGPYVEWYATLTVHVPDAVPSCGDGAIAIDVGWRSRPDGSIRVGMTHDGYGPDTEIVLPAEIISAIEKADSLRGTRDSNLDAILAQFTSWLAVATVHDWMREATETVTKWRSHARLAALVLRWSKERFEGDAEVFETMDQWRQQDLHLWAWEASQRDKALKRRRDHYRCIAARMAETYRNVVMEDFDLRKMARRPRVGSDSSYVQASSRNRTLACVSELRGAIENAFRSRGGCVFSIDPAGTTRTCNVCGVVDEVTSMAKLRQTCSNGHEWDQDENAARNILERWVSRAEEVAKADSTEESRWDRARRMRKERSDRLDPPKEEAS